MPVNIKAYLEKIKNLETALLNFIENESDDEENFQNLIIIFDDLNIRDDIHELKILLRMLLTISNNHHHDTNFFSKIERIFQDLKIHIQNHFTESDIFHFFKSNKRILLFFIEEKMITVDEDFAQEITQDDFSNEKYPKYFSPELQSLEKFDWLPDKVPDNFNELRKNGENEDSICQIIKNNSAKDVIAYVNKNSYSLNATINLSIYETNRFLIEKQKQKETDDRYSYYYHRFNRNRYDLNEVSLIEYAAFCGSDQIFKYLQSNGIELKPSLWMYAIHGQNVEIIRLLENNQISPENDDYKKCCMESIKCHHNEIASYICNNYLKEDDRIELIHQSILVANFSLIEDYDINEKIFFYLCKCDYYTLVKLVLKEKDIDINQKEISYNFFVFL